MIQTGQFATVEDSLLTEYLQPTLARLDTAAKILAQAEQAFPENARQIERAKLLVARLQEDVGDLITHLREEEQA